MRKRFLQQVVLPIVALSFGIGTQSVSGKAINDLNGLNFVLLLYYMEHKDYPDMLEDMSPLVYTGRRAFEDPWGQRYHYKRLARGYELYSYGPDRLPQTEDDICLDRDDGGCRRLHDFASDSPPHADLVNPVAQSDYSSEAGREWGTRLVLNGCSCASCDL